MLSKHLYHQKNLEASSCNELGQARAILPYRNFKTRSWRNLTVTKPTELQSKNKTSAQRAIHRLEHAIIQVRASTDVQPWVSFTDFMLVIQAALQSYISISCMNWWVLLKHDTSEWLELIDVIFELEMRGSVKRKKNQNRQDQQFFYSQDYPNRNENRGSIQNENSGKTISWI